MKASRRSDIGVPLSCINPLVGVCSGCFSVKVSGVGFQVSESRGQRYEDRSQTTKDRRWEAPSDERDDRSILRSWWSASGRSEGEKKTAIRNRNTNYLYSLAFYLYPFAFNLCPFTLNFCLPAFKPPSFPASFPSALSPLIGKNRWNSFIQNLTLNLQHSQFIIGCSIFHPPVHPHPRLRFHLWC